MVMASVALQARSSVDVCFFKTLQIQKNMYMSLTMNKIGLIKTSHILKYLFSINKINKKILPQYFIPNYFSEIS